MEVKQKNGMVPPFPKVEDIWE